MKTHFLPSLKLTAIFVFMFAGIYPLIMTTIAKAAAGSGNGVTITDHGKTVGYENIGQKFDRDDYFQGRPSAVDYNAAASGGSNKGPTNPGYLAQVQARIDTFLIHNPGVKKNEIPVDLITASGSGLDPDISVQAARIQVLRIAHTRSMNENELYALIEKTKEAPLWGFLGPEKVNVLKLNIALDNSSK